MNAPVKVDSGEYRLTTPGGVFRITRMHGNGSSPLGWQAVRMDARWLFDARTLTDLVQVIYDSPASGSDG